MTHTGAYLAQLREGRGMSKYAAAQASGVSHGNLFKIEHGQRFPTPGVIAQLSAAYGLDTTERHELSVAIAGDRGDPYREAVYGGCAMRMSDPAWNEVQEDFRAMAEDEQRREAAHWHGKPVGDLSEVEYNQWLDDIREMQGVEG